MMQYSDRIVDVIGKTMITICAKKEQLKLNVKNFYQSHTKVKVFMARTQKGNQVSMTSLFYVEGINTLDSLEDDYCKIFSMFEVHITRVELRNITYYLKHLQSSRKSHPTHTR